MKENEGKYERYGRVSSVIISQDKKDVFVNVITGPNREPRKMPFVTPKKGAWFVPQEGDIVEVQDIDGTRTARNPVDKPDPPMPGNLGEGDVCFSLNGSTKLHFSHQPDGTVNVDLTLDGKLTIDLKDTDGKDDPLQISLEKGSATLSLEDGDVTATTKKGDVSVNTDDGDVTATAPQGQVDMLAPVVRAGTSGGTFKPVARKGDSITGTDGDGQNITGQISEGSSTVESS